MNLLEEYKKLENEVLASELANNRKKNQMLRELKSIPLEEIISQPKTIQNKKTTNLFGWLKRIFGIK